MHFSDVYCDRRLSQQVGRGGGGQYLLAHAALTPPQSPHSPDFLLGLPPHPSCHLPLRSATTPS